MFLNDTIKTVRHPRRPQLGALMKAEPHEVCVKFTELGLKLELFPEARPAAGEPWGMVQMRTGQWYALAVWDGYLGTVLYPCHAPRINRDGRRRPH